MPSANELNIRNASAMQMAETMFGDAIQVLSATYSGDNRSAGIYRDGDQISGRLTPSDEGVILSTGRTRDVTNTSGNPNAKVNTSTNTKGVNDDPDFNALAGGRTYDAAFLEVDFIPDTDILSIQFTFASEEYPEYVGSIFNDSVGVWINGQLVNSSVFNTTDISNLNEGANESLYVDNTGSAVNTEMDGLTVTLSLVIPVNPGVENTIKIGIADVGDSQYDSNLLIAANSIQGEFLARDDAAEVFFTRDVTVDVLANDDGVGFAFVTHINGQEVQPGDSVSLNNDYTITLNADGTLTVEAPPGLEIDDLPPAFNFSYTAETDDGVSDTAFVKITTIPCFARGTRILMADGTERPVEALSVGDMVETADSGAQPVRWIGCRTVAAEGRFAPIAIEAGTFGHHRRLVLSPQHRVCVRHYMAELMFGEDEVLVAAKDLVNDCSVRRLEGGKVEYFHLLFDRHQMVWSEGLLTESFLPGPQTLPGFEEDLREELFALFPELDRETGLGYGAAARPALRSYEAKALMAGGRN